MMRLFTMLFVVALLFGCGGGGGGSSSTPSRDGVGTDSSGVRLIHAALEVPPLDLFVSSRSGELLQTSRFLSPAGYSSLSEGDQIAQLAVSHVGGVRVQRSFSYSSGALVTLVVWSPFGDGALRVAALEDEAALEDQSKAALRLFHGVTNTDSLSFRIIGNGVREALLGTVTGFVELVAGEYEFRVSDSETGQLLASGQVTLTEGESRTVVVGGEQGIFVTQAVY